MVQLASRRRQVNLLAALDLVLVLVLVLKVILGRETALAANVDLSLRFNWTKLAVINGGRLASIIGAHIVGGQLRLSSKRCSLVDGELAQLGARMQLERCLRLPIVGWSWLLFRILVQR